ncbi:MAG: 1-deoxy-D-xylulose-5-phosphate reductoisomerase [Pseudomonadota bacterium]
MLQKNISILGSTGSIGKNCLEIIRTYPDKFKVVGLSAYNNIDELASQINEFKPPFASIYNAHLKDELKNKINHNETEIIYGNDGNCKIATIDSCEMVVSAMVGAYGLRPVVEAIKAQKDIAFANKEVLVTAGHIIMDMLKETKINFLPVDSEHSAIFQCLQGHSKSELKRIILTASGGPFRSKKAEELENVTVSEALSHPNWNMGSRITIDSATMMNKGLELIEAKWLFNIKADQIDILIHPESLVHSLVEFCDGAMIAQLAACDMKLPIAFALNYPKRIDKAFSTIDLATISSMHFLKPDVKTFKCLGLAKEAINSKTSVQAIMNAANEVARDAFLKEEIKFLDIPDIIEAAMNIQSPFDTQSIEEVIRLDKWARNEAKSIIKQKFSNIR